MAFHCCVGILLLIILTGVYGESNEYHILNGLLSGDYNPEVRPSGPNGTDPTVVSVNLYVRSFTSVDDVNMEYSVQLTFRQQWTDSRLVYNQNDLGRPYMTLFDPTKIWVPDLFFTNEKSGHTHNLLKPNMYIRIFPDGSILYSLRVTLTLSCPMNLKMFPFDTQSCSLRMASYAWTSDDVIFRWKEFDPVQTSPVLNIPNFMIEKFVTDYCDSQSNTGIYSCVRVDFFLKRIPMHYLVHVYIPCASMVIVAGLSFWIAKAEVMGRLLLTLMTYLIMIIGVLLMNLTLPKVPYTKAIDVWTGCCLTFVFFALLEFITVNFITRRRKNNVGLEVKDKKWTNLLDIYKGWTLPDKIDITCRVLYPIVFIIFVCLYMSVYT